MFQLEKQKTYCMISIQFLRYIFLLEKDMDEPTDDQWKEVRMIKESSVEVKSKVEQDGEEIQRSEEAKDVTQTYVATKEIKSTIQTQAIHVKQGDTVHILIKEEKLDEEDKKVIVLKDEVDEENIIAEKEEVFTKPAENTEREDFEIVEDIIPSNEIEITVSAPADNFDTSKYDEYKETKDTVSKGEDKEYTEIKKDDNKPVYSPDAKIMEIGEMEVISMEDSTRNDVVSKQSMEIVTSKESELVHSSLQEETIVVSSEIKASSKTKSVNEEEIVSSVMKVSSEAIFATEEKNISIEKVEGKFSMDYNDQTASQQDDLKGVIIEDVTQEFSFDEEIIDDQQTSLLDIKEPLIQEPVTPTIERVKQYNQSVEIIGEVDDDNLVEHVESSFDSTQVEDTKVSHEEKTVETSSENISSSAFQQCKLEDIEEHLTQKALITVIDEQVKDEQQTSALGIKEPLIQQLFTPIIEKGQQDSQPVEIIGEVVDEHLVEQVMSSFDLTDVEDTKLSQEEKTVESSSEVQQTFTSKTEVDETEIKKVKITNEELLDEQVVSSFDSTHVEDIKVPLKEKTVESSSEIQQTFAPTTEIEQSNSPKVQITNEENLVEQVVSTFHSTHFEDSKVIKSHEEGTSIQMISSQTLIENKKVTSSFSSSNHELLKDSVVSQEFEDDIAVDELEKEESTSKAATEINIVDAISRMQEHFNENLKPSQVKDDIPSLIKEKDKQMIEVEKEDAAEIETKPDKKEEIVTFDLLTAIQGMHDTLTESVSMSSEENVKETTSDAQIIGTTIKEPEGNVATVIETKESFKDKSEKEEVIVTFDLINAIQGMHDTLTEVQSSLSSSDSKTQAATTEESPSNVSIDVTDDKYDDKEGVVSFDILGAMQKMHETLDNSSEQLTAEVKQHSNDPEAIDLNTTTSKALSDVLPVASSIMLVGDNNEEASLSGMSSNEVKESEIKMEEINSIMDPSLDNKTETTLVSSDIESATTVVVSKIESADSFTIVEASQDTKSVISSTEALTSSAIDSKFSQLSTTISSSTIGSEMKSDSTDFISGSEFSLTSMMDAKIATVSLVSSENLTTTTLSQASQLASSEKELTETVIVSQMQSIVGNENEIVSASSLIKDQEEFHQSYDISMKEEMIKVESVKSFTEVVDCTTEDIETFEVSSDDDGDEDLLVTVSNLQRSASDKIEQIMKTIQEVDDNLKIQQEQVEVDDGNTESYIHVTKIESKLPPKEDSTLNFQHEALDMKGGSPTGSDIVVSEQYPHLTKSQEDENINVSVTPIEFENISSFRAHFVLHFPSCNDENIPKITSKEINQSVVNESNSTFEDNAKLTLEKSIEGTEEKTLPSSSPKHVKSNTTSNKVKFDSDAESGFEILSSDLMSSSTREIESTLESGVQDCASISDKTLEEGFPSMDFVTDIDDDSKALSSPSAESVAVVKVKQAEEAPSTTSEDNIIKSEDKSSNLMIQPVLQAQCLQEKAFWKTDESDQLKENIEVQNNQEVASGESSPVISSESEVSFRSHEHSRDNVTSSKSPLSAALKSISPEGMFA